MLVPDETGEVMPREGVEEYRDYQLFQKISLNLSQKHRYKERVYLISQPYSNNILDILLLKGS